MWLVLILACEVLNYILTSCTGGTICRSASGAKYISMATLPNTSYDMACQPFAVSNAFECHRACLRADRCLVVKMKAGKCCLGAHKDNPFEKKRLIPKEGWSTMYVMHVKCQINPCGKRGDCIPDYTTGSYTCKCYKSYYYGDNCEEGDEKVWGGFSYMRIVEVSISWMEAQRACQKEGATLVMPKDEGAMGFLREEFRTDYYLGGYYNSLKRWQWVDGSYIVANHWGKGEPNGVEHGNYYIINSHLDQSWHTAKWKVLNNALCQRKITAQETECS